MTTSAFALTVGQAFADGETVLLTPVLAADVRASSTAIGTHSASLTGHQATQTAALVTAVTDIAAITTAANAVYALTGYSGLTGAAAAQTTLNAAIATVLSDNTTQIITNSMINTDKTNIAADSAFLAAGLGDAIFSCDHSKVTSVTCVKRVFDAFLQQTRGNGSFTQ